MRLKSGLSGSLQTPLRTIVKKMGVKPYLKKDNIWVVTVPQQKILVTVYSEDRVADKLTIQKCGKLSRRLVKH